MLEIEMERRLTETEQRSKSNTHRIDEDANFEVWIAVVS